jgi:hypothetical protein
LARIGTRSGWWDRERRERRLESEGARDGLSEGSEVWIELSAILSTHLLTNMGISDDDVPFPPSPPSRPHSSFHSNRQHRENSYLPDKLLLSIRIPSFPHRVLEKVYREKKRDWRIVLPTPKQEPIDHPKQSEEKYIIIQTKSRPESRDIRIARPVTYQSKKVPTSPRTHHTPMISFTSVIQAGDHLRSKGTPSHLRRSLQMPPSKDRDWRFLSFDREQTERGKAVGRKEEGGKARERPATAKARSTSFTFNEHYRVSVALSLPTPTFGERLVRL